MAMKNQKIRANLRDLRVALDRLPEAKGKPAVLEVYRNDTLIKSYVIPTAKVRESGQDSGKSEGKN